ncbi:hypothetical protein NDI76_22270 [Halogeometricum sp. S1BR25-6]|uniref:Uncharacterized protein n=1 Tax=Halogeometricum salsisoli TaxID=2950536 RepID=A0ABU2GKW2_9EURY|nr:hypothetical protein [Halogeometricum sp. S1BR25-6]MDS0301458.1 hypothetical protein [Halogeometricum sp. S1BR25-6]
MNILFEMNSRRVLPFALSALVILVIVGAAVPVTASPAPVSACPPCGDGFVRAAASHGLATEARHGEATVRVHDNGSATWTARVVPTNESVLDRLAANESLACAVAGDSFGVRYGSGIEHELLAADAVNGTFVVWYRTLGVVRESVFGTQTLTYFRDSPGAYVYTGLGADELTVVAPEGMTIASGFGTVEGNRMTATELPDARDGPFVVFASTGSITPGLLGIFAVTSALAGVIVRNFLLFVVVLGSVLVGGIAGMRRFTDSATGRRPALLGWGVAGSGALLLLGTLVTEADILSELTGNLLAGGVVSGFPGAAVALPDEARPSTAAPASTAPCLRTVRRDRWVVLRVIITQSSAHNVNG